MPDFTGLVNVGLTIITVSITVLLWWALVLKPRMKRYVAENAIVTHEATAAVEVKHKSDPLLRPMRILIITNLPPLEIGDSRMERITKRIGFEAIQDADYVVAIDTNEVGTVVKDRDGYGEEGWEVQAFTRRVING